MVTKPDLGSSGWGTTLNAALDDLQAQATAVAARATTLESQGEFRASDHGWQVWNYDVNTGAQTSLLTSGTVYMSRLNVRSSMTVSTLNYIVSTAGSTLTAGQNFVGLYDSSGTRVAVSADLAADWTASGYKTTAFTASASLTTGAYFAAWLSVGTTPITVARASAMNSSALNAGLTAAAARYSTGGTGWTAQTSLPSPGTMANRTAGATSIWCALS